MRLPKKEKSFSKKETKKICSRIIKKDFSMLKTLNKWKVAKMGRERLIATLLIIKNRHQQNLTSFYYLRLQKFLSKLIFWTYPFMAIILFILFSYFIINSFYIGIFKNFQYFILALYQISLVLCMSLCSKFIKNIGKKKNILKRV